MRRAAWALCAFLAAVPFLARGEDVPVGMDDVRRLEAAGDIANAARAAGALASERPGDVDVQVAYQDLVVRLGETRELVKSYRARASKEGAGADDLYLYARLLEDKAAIAEHRRTLRLDAAHVRTLLALGDLHLARNELGDAEEALTAAVAAAPELAAPRLGLAELRRRSGEPDLAEELLRAAVEKEPCCVLARVELAIILAEMARYDEARTTLTQASELAPDDPLPYLALGHLERMLGRDPIALREFEARRQAELDAAAAEAAIAAEKAAEEARKAEEAGAPPPRKPKDDAPFVPEDVGSAATRAMDAFQAAVDAAPRSFPALVLLAHAATAAGDGLTAQAALVTARGLHPEKHEPGTFRARLQLDQEMVAEAEVTSDEVLDDHRDLAVALYLHAVAQARLGGGRKAEKDLERALRVSGDDPLYLRGLGALHAANGRWRDAIKVFQKVVRATDAAPRAVYELALAQRGAGKPKDAASSLEALVADDPENIDAWLLLGRVYREDMRKKEQRALECLQRYVELGGDNEVVPYWIQELQGS